MPCTHGGRIAIKPLHESEREPIDESVKECIGTKANRKKLFNFIRFEEKIVSLIELKIIQHSITKTALKNRKKTFLGMFFLKENENFCSFSSFTLKQFGLRIDLLRLFLEATERLWERYFPFETRQFRNQNFSYSVSIKLTLECQKGTREAQRTQLMKKKETSQE